MHPLARLDHRYLWHPFTQMKEWLEREPILLVKGEGARVWDLQGKEYLDANASIWTNLHGHRNRRLNQAIVSQLDKIAHSSALGFANEPASLLAERLIRCANARPSPVEKRGGAARRKNLKSPAASSELAKVFFSDDGSTAMEAALKMAHEFARRTRRIKSPRFLSLQGGYHGDTVGAVSLGHIDLFHKTYRNLLFKTDAVAAPYCYRCPFNQAKPERIDARDHRRCHWECVGWLKEKFRARKNEGGEYAGFVVEPVIQGAAGMIAQPRGWLNQAAELARDFGAPLIADEVMTGFGRTGGASLFACHRENVKPDFLVVAKGLTGGYLPMAATLTTQNVFDAFLGDYGEFKTFFHGHSFTGNQLGAAAASASLDLLESPASVKRRSLLEGWIRDALQPLWRHPNVGDIRQAGLVAGVELTRNWKTREPFKPREQAGIRVCDALARRGVLTRPIGNVIVLMPPYCVTAAQTRRIVSALRESIEEVFGKVEL